MLKNAPRCCLPGELLVSFNVFWIINPDTCLDRVKHHRTSPLNRLLPGKRRQAAWLCSQGQQRPYRRWTIARIPGIYLLSVFACERLMGRTSLNAIIIVITITPAITLRSAEACAACLAPIGERDPIRFPTRVDAATPIPKGRVLRTNITWNVSTQVQIPRTREAYFDL